MIEDIKATDAENQANKASLDRHIEDYKSSFLTTTFNQDKNESNFRSMQGKTENLKAYLDGKLESLTFDLSRKVRVDDVKQNFK